MIYRMLMLITFAITSVFWHGEKTLAANMKPEDVPTFQIRFRVDRIENQVPSVTDRITFKYTQETSTTGTNWSDWITYTRANVPASLPEDSLPLVTRAFIEPRRSMTIFAEVKIDGTNQTRTLSANLFDGFNMNLAILLWRDDNNTPQVGTMADYNKQNWDNLDSLPYKKKDFPKLITVSDRYTEGDNDLTALHEGISNLLRAGMNTIFMNQLSPLLGTNPRALRDQWLASGAKYTGGMSYRPPGDYETRSVDKERIQAWADETAMEFRRAGFLPDESKKYVISDEPNWHVPLEIRRIKESRDEITRFRDYLRAQKLTPQQLGANGWHEIEPIAMSQATTLEKRRLFYWSMRYMAWTTCRFYSNSTKALEESFYPGIETITTWNNFQGRAYAPTLPNGSVGNDASSPDAAEYSQDWLECGKERSGTMLWSEDWFGDAKAFVWSLRSKILHSATKRSNVHFGSYMIGRSSINPLQKTFAILGNGGKSIMYYTFGPEYNFPGNGFSENEQLLPNIANIAQLIAKVEDVLKFGEPPQAEVGIIQPKSSNIWTVSPGQTTKPRGISNAGYLTTWTEEVMAETFGVSFALLHKNIHHEYIDEDDLTTDKLKPFKVIYLTGYNIDETGQQALLTWVKSGGQLILTPGAGTRNRYDELKSPLSEATGTVEVKRERLYLLDVGAELKYTDSVKTDQGLVCTAGVQADYTQHSGNVIARFENNKPAITQHTLDKGMITRFAYSPGLSAWRAIWSWAAPERCDESQFYTHITWLTDPVKHTVTPPVTTNVPGVESPILYSDHGAAVTLLNWSGEWGFVGYDVLPLNTKPLDKVEVTAYVPFQVKTATSAIYGGIPFAQQGNTVTFSLPLDQADTIALRP